MQPLALSEVRWLDGSVALVVCGTVDDDTVEHFETTLDVAMANGSRPLVIDLTACRLASAGLAALIRLQRRSGSTPAHAPLVVTDPDALGILQIVGLTSRFQIYRTLDAARRSCGAGVLAGAVESVPAAGPRDRALAAVPDARHLTSVESAGGRRLSRPGRQARRGLVRGSRPVAGAGNE